MGKESSKVKKIVRKQTGLIFASKLYFSSLSNVVSEQNYYKILERMVEKEELGKVARGIYYIAKKGKYGIIKPSTNDVINTFTSNNTGIVIGYDLYNKYGISTQISKEKEVYSSIINEDVRNISNVNIKKLNAKFSKDNVDMIEALEIAENYSHIQDINKKAFISYFKMFSNKYNDKMLESILKVTKYKKSTLAFLKNILDFYHVNNNINKYYSSLSKFKNPKMEDLVETA